MDGKCPPMSGVCDPIASARPQKIKRSDALSIYSSCGVQLEDSGLAKLNGANPPNSLFLIKPAPRQVLKILLQEPLVVHQILSCGPPGTSCGPPDPLGPSIINCATDLKLLGRGRGGGGGYPTPEKRRRRRRRRRRRIPYP
jgi:hypothetical protein